MKLKGTHTVSILRLEDPAAFSMDLVASRAFDPDLKDGSDTPVSGFVSCLDPLVVDPRARSGIGQYYIFSLRQDQKKVPAPMLRLAVAEAVKEKETADGRRLSRQQRKELKENVRLALVRRMGYSSVVTDFAFDPESGLLLAFEGPGRKLDAAVATMADLGCAVSRDFDLPLEELFSALCSEAVNVDGYHFSDAGAVTLVGTKDDNPSKVTASNAADVVMSAVGSGYTIRTMRLRVEDRSDLEFCTFVPVVGDYGLSLKGLTFAVQGMDTLPGEEVPATGAEDAPAPAPAVDDEETDLILLLEGVILTSRLFGKLVDVVEAHLGQDRDGSASGAD